MLACFVMQQSLTDTPKKFFNRTEDQIISIIFKNSTLYVHILWTLKIFKVFWNQSPVLKELTSIYSLHGSKNLAGILLSKSYPDLILSEGLLALLFAFALVWIPGELSLLINPKDSCYFWLCKITGVYSGTCKLEVYLIKVDLFLSQEYTFDTHLSLAHSDT